MPSLAQVYAQLESIGVPTPHWGWHDHTDAATAHELVRVEDGIEIRGKRINKPFVEKPVDAEDHNVYVYYPDSVGGGSKRLFRKVADQSSQFYPGENSLRTDGAYIYEEFLETQGVVASLRERRVLMIGRRLGEKHIHIRYCSILVHQFPRILLLICTSDRKLH